MKNSRRLAVLAFFASVLLFGCVQTMGKKGRLRPLEGKKRLGAFARKPPEGTVPQDEPLIDLHALVALKKMPLRLSRDLLERGRDQFNAYCLPCHGPSGHGDGMVVKRGFLAPPSYHISRLRNASDGHFFDVITHGFGAMYSYADRVSPDDRWAITVYIRALQKSENTRLSELRPAEQRKLKEMHPQ